jgi:hypothetical protein
MEELWPSVPLLEVPSVPLLLAPGMVDDWPCPAVELDEPRPDCPDVLALPLLCPAAPIEELEEPLDPA